MSILLFRPVSVCDTEGVHVPGRSGQEKSGTAGRAAVYWSRQQEPDDPEGGNRNDESDNDPQYGKYDGRGRRAVRTAEP